MNRLLVGFGGILCFLLVGASGAQAQATPRFAYINSQRIMAEAPGTSEAQAAFEEDMQRYQEELATLEAELDTLQTNFARQQATLSADVRQQRQQEIQTKITAYQQRRTELETQAQQRQSELVAPIMERVSDVIEQIREEGDYAMILDAATGALITADPSLDLTEEVLTRLEAQTPAQ